MALIRDGLSPERAASTGDRNQKASYAHDAGQGVPAVVGVTFSFGLPNSFTVLCAGGWPRSYGNH